MKCGVVSSAQIKETGRLDAGFYLDRCEHCGAQEKYSTGKIGVWQHDEEGRCFKVVQSRHYLGTTFTQRG